MNTVTAQEALERLKKGNLRYTDDKLTHPRTDNARKEELINGQDPFAIILSCADSRVAPEYAFDEGLGDVFVIRVAGNTANASSIASIEYAVANLGTKLIVVMGHESCGACGAAIKIGQEDNGPNLNHLLSMINPAVEASKDKEVNDVVRINAKMQAENLRKNSAIIDGAVQHDDVKIVTAFYNLKNNGRVDFD